jgi:hypothetical protein
MCESLTRRRRCAGGGYVVTPVQVSLYVDLRSLLRRELSGRTPSTRASHSASVKRTAGSCSPGLHHSWMRLDAAANCVCRCPLSHVAARPAVRIEAPIALDDLVGAMKSGCGVPLVALYGISGTCLGCLLSIAVNGRLEFTGGSTNSVLVGRTAPEARQSSPHRDPRISTAADWRNRMTSSTPAQHSTAARPSTRCMSNTRTRMRRSAGRAEPRAIMEIP